MMAHICDRFPKTFSSIVNRLCQNSFKKAKLSLQKYLLKWTQFWNRKEQRLTSEGKNLLSFVIFFFNGQWNIWKYTQPPPSLPCCLQFFQYKSELWRLKNSSIVNRSFLCKLKSNNFWYNFYFLSRSSYISKLLPLNQFLCLSVPTDINIFFDIQP